MRKTRDRRGRNHSSAPGQRPHKRGRVSLRLAATLIAFALLGGVCSGIPAADATTGGLSPYPSSPPEGGGVAFGAFRTAGASWYGPGLYGNRTACGETLRKNTLGVAHRSLPCGTTVKFVYHGHSLVTQVIDRGPYVHGRSWDLTQAAGEAIDLDGVGQVRYAVALDDARRPEP